MVLLHQLVSTCGKRLTPKLACISMISTTISTKRPVVMSAVVNAMQTTASLSSPSSSSMNDQHHVGTKNFNMINYQQVRTLRLWKERVLREMYWRGKQFDVEEPKLRARSEWQDWNYSSEVYAFGQRLGEGQLSEEALTQAFTHRSYLVLQEQKQKQLGITDVRINLLENTELIEQGHQLIEQYVGKYLRYHLKTAPEECIQSLVQYLLSEPVLSDISKWIGCIDMILCEEFPPSETTLANTVLALVGVVARENGPKRAENFIVDFICTYLNGQDLLEIWPIDQLNLDLNHYLRAQGKAEVEPRILYQSAIGTIESCYVVGLYQEQKLLAKASGESLAIAKQMAELEVFRRMFGLTIDEVKFSFGKNAYELNLRDCEQKHFFISPPTGEQKMKRVSH